MKPAAGENFGYFTTLHIKILCKFQQFRRRFWSPETPNSPENVPTIPKTYLPLTQNLPSTNLPQKTYLPPNLPSKKPTYHQTYLPKKPTFQKTYLPLTKTKKTYLPWKGGLEVNLPSSFTLICVVPARILETPAVHG